MIEPRSAKGTILGFISDWFFLSAIITTITNIKIYRGIGKKPIEEIENNGDNDE